MVACLPLAGVAHAQTMSGVTDEHAAACTGLAETVADATQLTAQVEAFLKTFEASMKPGDGSIGDLNQKFPGLTPKIVATMRPLVLASAARYIKPYQAELSQMYCANLTLADVRTAKAEMSTPAFRTFVQRAMRQVKFEGVVQDIIAEKDITDSALRNEYKSAANKVTLTPEESASIMRFLSSPTGRKLTAINGQKAKIEAKWFNYSTPQDDRAMELAIIKAMSDHIALTDKEMGERLRKTMLAELPKQGEAAAR
ncbi:MAG: hypothetical protein ACKOPO_00830 [Novosphingobium sp.]